MTTLNTGISSQLGFMVQNITAMAENAAMFHAQIAARLEAQSKAQEDQPKAQDAWNMRIVTELVEVKKELAVIKKHTIEIHGMVCSEFNKITPTTKSDIESVNTDIGTKEETAEIFNRHFELADKSNKSKQAAD